MEGRDFGEAEENSLGYQGHLSYWSNGPAAQEVKAVVFPGTGPWFSPRPMKEEGSGGFSRDPVTQRLAWGLGQEPMHLTSPEGNMVHISINIE